MFASKVIDYSPPITEETLVKWYKSVMLTMGGPRYADIVERKGEPPLLILHYGDSERELVQKAKEFWTMKHDEHLV